MTPTEKHYNNLIREHEHWSIHQIAKHYHIPYRSLLAHNKRYTVRRSGAISHEIEQAVVGHARRKKNFNVSAISELYNISDSSVYRMLNKHGIVKKRPKQNRNSREKTEQINMIIRKHPEYTISEIAEELNMPTSTVQYNIQKHRIPYQTKAACEQSDNTCTMLNLKPDEVQTFIALHPTYTKQKIAEAYGVNVKTFNNFLKRHPHIIYKSKRTKPPTEDELCQLVKHLKRRNTSDYDIRTYMQRKYGRERSQINRWLNTEKIKKELGGHNNEKDNRKRA